MEDRREEKLEVAKHSHSEDVRKVFTRNGVPEQLSF